MIAISMAPHHFQRDFDDLGMQDVMTELKSNSGYVRPQVNPSPLDILSATSYFDQQPTVQRPQSVSPDMSMGYVIEDEEMSDSRPIAQRKKVRIAARGSNSPEKAKMETTSKKQRGRPKLEPLDETAADRRRTQIRLAQRAYRQRKETTIASLKEKVSELQLIIEQMNRTFTQLHDNLIDSGILVSSSGTSLAQQLHTAIEKYQQLTKAAAIDWDQDEENENVSRVRGRQGTPSGSSRVSDDGEVAEAQSLSAIPTSYQFDFNVEEVRHPYRSQATQVAPSQIAQLESTLINAVESGRLEEARNTGGDLETSLPDTGISGGYYTYSFQETTFARRLHRQCLELGFRYLSNPATDPEYIMKTFRFTFTFSNRRRILARFQELLKRKAGESLENWNVPFFPIGGAGTHFPRQDEVGNVIYPPNMLDPTRAFGPKDSSIEVETPMAEDTTEKVLKAIGFDGEWYDSHDVEEYLKTKGIFLDAQTSFVTVDAKIMQSGETAVKQSGSSRSGEQTGRSPLQSPPLQPDPASNLSIPIRSGAGNVSGLIQTFGQSNFLSTSGDSGRSQHHGAQDSNADLGGNAQGLDANTSWLWNLPDTETQGSSFSTQTLMFDVERFLGRLVDKACCLGRAPGFRKRDVDDALRYALQDVF